VPGVLAVAVDQVLVVLPGAVRAVCPVRVLGAVLLVRVADLLSADGLAAVPVFHDARSYGRFLAN
jgi:hypothetical protein